MADIDSVSSSVDGMNLPYSPEAEQAVLATIIMDGECMAEVIQILPQAECFYLATHRSIYTAMIELFVMNTPIDVITILEKLKQQKDYDDASFKSYLYQISEMLPSRSNITEYAEIVKNSYQRRRLILASREIINNASEYGDNVSTLIDSAEQSIFDIRDDNSNRTGLQRVDSIILDVLDRIDILNSPESSEMRAIPTGIGTLDNVITGLNRSDLIILAARPGMGKTSFALNIMRHVAVSVKKRVAFFSLEMSKEQLASRLISTEGMIEGTKLRTGKLQDDDWARLIEAGDVLRKTEMYFDDTPGISVPELKAKLRRLKDVDLVIVDYLQLMSGSRRTESRVNEISEITRSLKALAKEFNVPVIALSQLSRASEKRENRKPQLSDLRDSGSIEQDADIVLFLYREGYYDSIGSGNDEEKDNNSGECIVAKNRHGEARSVPLHWQGEYMRYTAQELSRGE